MYITFHLFVTNFGPYSPFMEMNVLNQNYIIGLCTRLPTDENKFSLPMKPSPSTFKPARQHSIQVGSEVVPYSPRFDSV
ncbi:hypothetical protein JCM24511_00696 [Saitozyma sp. JCM 24511]|nr:hypothetical protein JCM24511_00696 [Saitozyma sp. JCM 24511]